MTISSKLVNVSGLSFAVSQETDTIDVGGFSDPIQTVGAKTAKFSGGATMQANSGLRIGMTQLKIITIGATPGVRLEDVFSSYPKTGATVDNSNATSSATASSAGSAVVDYGSINTRSLQLVTMMNATGAEFGSGDMTMFYEISDDNITFSAPTQFLFLNIPAGGDMMGGIPHSTGQVTFNAGALSFRYVRITQSTSGSGSAKTWTIFQFTEQQTVTPTVTVRVRSSNTIDTADGDIIINDQVMDENETLTFIIDLLLTGPTQFVTLQIVSLTGFDIPVTLSEITSIKEV